ncbi:uncharacterized protein LOC115453670 [Manduca sexta]|uniref:uncharacterized protein LOC115453670 n=1 Tax=Manduca sexta TaxID=7130 RepID=UPI0018906E93|nr:uncharacterized protein LOC115453670 [Manduca sexta]
MSIIIAMNCHCTDVRPNGACINRRATRPAAFLSHYPWPWYYIFTHVVVPARVFLPRRAFYGVLARCTITDSRRTGELPPDHVQLRTTIVGCADPDRLHTLLTHVAFQLPGELPPEPATCNIYVPFAWIGVPEASDSCCITPATSTECNAEV